MCCGACSPTWLWGSLLGSPSSDPQAPVAPSGLAQACRRRWSACSIAGGRSRTKIRLKTHGSNQQLPGRRMLTKAKRGPQIANSEQNCYLTHVHKLCAPSCRNTVPGEIKHLFCWAAVKVCMSKHTWLTAPHIKMKALLGNCRWLTRHCCLLSIVHLLLLSISGDCPLPLKVWISLIKPAPVCPQLPIHPAAVFDISPPLWGPVYICQVQQSAAALRCVPCWGRGLRNSGGWQKSWSSSIFHWPSLEQRLTGMD